MTIQDRRSRSARPSSPRATGSHCLLVGLSLLLFTHLGDRTAGAQLLDLSPATTQEVLHCNGVDPVIELVESEVDDQCTGTNTAGVSAASVSSTFGPTISAFSSVGCDCLLDFDVSLTESVTVNLELRVRETSAPAQINNGAPVRFTSFARVEASQIGVGGSAFVRVRSSPEASTGFGDVFDVFETTFIEAPDFVPLAVADVSETAVLLVNQIHPVTIVAGCNLRRDERPNGSVQCISQVSLSFEFDQAAFDTLKGVNTFPLTDHYQLEMSANIVPEPPAPASALAVLVALFALVRAREPARVS